MSGSRAGGDWVGWRLIGESLQMTDTEIAQLQRRGWEFNATTGLFHLAGRTDDDSIVDWEDVLAALPVSFDTLDAYMARANLIPQTRAVSLN